MNITIPIESVHSMVIYLVRCVFKHNITAHIVKMDCIPLFCFYLIHTIGISFYIISDIIPLIGISYHVCLYSNIGKRLSFIVGNFACYSNLRHSGKRKKE